MSVSRKARMVKKGFCLFKLDCRTYEAACCRRKQIWPGTLPRQKNADEDLKRYTPSSKSNM